MDADDDLLIEVAGAVLDGAPTNWSAFSSDASESVRAVLGELRAIAAIGSVTRSFVGALGRAPDQPLPESWGHLRLFEPLGRGAFGAVLRAWDTKLDREVALKLLAADDPSTSAVIEEGRLLARVHHPNVVTIFGADRIDSRAGLWMEIVRGETLEQIVARDGPLPIRRVQDIARQLLDALDAVHEAGLVHRDVKTQNVMLTDAGRVVLMDFGAGRMADSSGGDVAGTPLYLAPEIFERRPATSRSDIYSAGVVLYRLLTGRFPVEGRTMGQVRDRHLSPQTAVRDVRRFRRGVPRFMARAVEKALAADPFSRFASAREMAAALEPPRVNRPMLAAAVVIPLAIAGFLLTQRVGMNRAGFGGGSGVLQPTAVVADTARTRRLTVPADARFYLAGLSADGRFFTYTAQDGSVRQVTMADGSFHTLVSPDGDQTADFAVSSPDGSEVVYQWWNARQAYELRLFDTRSGATRTLLSDDAVDVPQPVQWSADGAELLVLERMKGGARRIALVDTTAGRLRVVRELTAGTPLGLSVSVDRQFVAYDMPRSDNSRFRTLHIIRTNGSEDRELPSGEYSDWSPLWTPDGRGIFFLSDRTGAPDGWFAAAAEGATTGEPQVIVRNLARVMPLGFTTGGALYYRLQTGAFDVFSIQPETGDATPRRLSGRFRGSNIGASYSPDGGSVAYIAVRDGYGSERDRSIVVRNLASGDERELHPLADLGVAAPRWSPDGRLLLVRGSSPMDGPGIRAVDVTTGRVHHVVAHSSEKDETDIGPMGWDTTRDGAVYERAGKGLIRHSVTTGEERVLYSYASGQMHGRIHRFGFTDAGGTRLAFSAFFDGGPRALAIVDRGIERTLVTVSAPQMLVFQGWSRDARWIYYTVVPNGAAPHELWRVAADGGNPERLPVNIPGATQINSLSVNPVTGALAYTAGTPTTEVWMMEGFLPREQ